MGYHDQLFVCLGFRSFVVTVRPLLTREQICRLYSANRLSVYKLFAIFAVIAIIAPFSVMNAIYTVIVKVKVAS